MCVCVCVCVCVRACGGGGDELKIIGYKVNVYIAISEKVKNNYSYSH
jgi:hypothetical protein